MNLYRLTTENSIFHVTANNSTIAIVKLKETKKIKYASRCEFLTDTKLIIPTLESDQEMNIYVVIGDDNIHEYISSANIVEACIKFEHHNPGSLKLKTKFICKRNEIISTIKIKEYEE